MLTRQYVLRGAEEEKEAGRGVRKVWEVGLEGSIPFITSFAVLQSSKCSTFSVEDTQVTIHQICRLRHSLLPVVCLVLVT